MEYWEKKIKALNDAIEENERQINESRYIIGKNVSALERTEIEKTPFEESYDSVKDLKDQIKEHQEAVNQLNSTITDLKKVEDTLKEMEEDREKIEKSWDPHYEEIGIAFYESFGKKEVEEIPGSYDFSEIASETKEISSKLVNIEQIDRDVTLNSLFKKTIGKGKKLIIQGNIKTRQTLLNHQLRKAGKFFLSLDNPDYTPELLTAMEPIDTSRQKWQHIRDDEVKRNEEKEQLRQEVDAGRTFEGSRNPVKKLEEKIGETKERVVELYRKMGSIFITSPIESIGSSKDITSAVEAISVLSKKNEGYSETISRMTAAIEIIKLEKQINTFTKKKENIEEELHKKKEEMKKIEKELETLNSDKAKQEELRGPVEELVDEE